MANPKTLKTWKRRSLAEIGKMSGEYVCKQEAAYIEWLAEKRGTDKYEANDYARSFRNGNDVDVAPIESRVRHAEVIGRAIIRTVRVAGARTHYGRTYMEEMGFEKLPKPDAPTVYMVEIDGKVVNSFLRKSLAKEYAERVAA